MRPARWIRRWPLCLWLATAAAWGQPATVADTHGGANTFFVALEANGKPFDTDAVRETQRASAGRGSNLVVKEHERTLPAGPTALRLRAVTIDPPTLHAEVSTLWRTGTPLQMEGVLQVELKPGGRYRVNGVVDDFRREVWLEDETGARVGPPAASSLSAEEQRVMAGNAHLCCNQRHNGDWVSDANWPHFPLVPAGSRVTVRDYGRNEIAVLIEGRRMRIGNEYGRAQESVVDLLRQLLVDEDPRPRIARMPASARTAIAYGRVLPGMSRDEVTVSLGRPRRDLNKTLDGPRWVYETYDAGFVTLVFGADGRLVSLEGEPKARAQLLLPASIVVP